MEIGIVGKGKMGRDIFDYIFTYDHKLVLICRRAEDIQDIKNSIEKQLSKMLKRCLITQEQYEAKRLGYAVSHELSALQDCDLVIECINEDKELKKNIFNKLESFVKTDCILATNSSSIPPEIVFEKCKIKERCLGIHFFFPVKINSFVEVNKACFTNQKYVNKAVNLLTRLEKKVLELGQADSLIVTRVLTILIAQIYSIFKENYLTIQDIEKLIKKELLTFGEFEMIDATGLPIIVSAVGSFMTPRYAKLFAPLYNTGREAIEKGFMGGSSNKGFADYELQQPVSPIKLDDQEMEAYKKGIILRLRSLIVNEFVYMVNTTGIDKNLLSDAIKEGVGLNEDPISTLKLLGTQKIKDCLLNSAASQQDELYSPLDFSVLLN